MLQGHTRASVVIEPEAGGDPPPCQDAPQQQDHRLSVNLAAFKRSTGCTGASARGAAHAQARYGGLSARSGTEHRVSSEFLLPLPTLATRPRWSPAADLPVGDRSRSSALRRIISPEWYRAPSELRILVALALPLATRPR
jgi:hypothetical protein